ncbi:MAG: DUF2157 domain-containing protein, partial [Gammaproteobacteria bacterium]|nr:DUF2157 domain-containing protein [Gammaproteobacteria bacterium]
ESFGGWGIFAIALTYAALGIGLVQRFRAHGYTIPAGICAVFVVALVPIALYGLQQGLGWWPDDTPYRDYHRYIKWHWLFLEFGTLAAGAIMAWRYRYPFLLMPIAVTLWYMSMDIAVMLAGGQRDYEFRAAVSMYFGISMTLLAFWVDLRSSKSGDYAFWLYLFGVMTFWCGMTSQDSDSEFAKFIYFCVNLAMIGVGAMLVRRVFVVFGAIGGSLYLGHLASTVFKDSWLFPIALTAIGLGVIYLGIVWQKNEQTLSRKARNILPIPFQKLLDGRS